jgi:hypothetical protein
MDSMPLASSAARIFLTVSPRPPNSPSVGSSLAIVAPKCLKQSWVDHAARRRTSVAFGLIIIAIVGAVLAWQPSDEKTKDIVGAWGIWLSQLSSELGTKSPAVSDAATELISKGSEQGRCLIA